MATPTAAVPLSRQPIVLGSGPVRVTGAPVVLRDPALFPGPGSYSLVATVAERDIAAFEFRIVGRSEWLHQVKVGAVHLETETVEGVFGLEKGALHWGQHVAFRPVVRLESAIPAPNSPVKCVARILLGETLLRREELLLCLNDTSRLVRLERFSLQELGSSLWERRVRLTLSLHLGELERMAWPIVILPTERLTNFEGQLRCNDDDLSLDEEAYNDILRRLMSSPAARSRAPD